MRQMVLVCDDSCNPPPPFLPPPVPLDFSLASPVLFWIWKRSSCATWATSKHPALHQMCLNLLMLKALFTFTPTLMTPLTLN